MDYIKLEKVEMEKVKKGAKPPDDNIIGLFYTLSFGAEAVEGNEEFVFATFHILSDFKPSSDLQIALYWLSEGQNSGVAKWEASLVSILHDSAETLEKAPTVETILSTANSNLGGLVETNKITFSGTLFRLHDIVGIKIKRKSSDVADTLVGVADLVMLEYYYTSDRLGEKI